MTTIKELEDASERGWNYIMKKARSLENCYDCDKWTLFGRSCDNAYREIRGCQ
ncbi:MAG: hypothetical protein GF411_00040 [Candidatus Lokiarchaeota archaeon]|nr:hypothetical protein [Candidatus Lokiarchaeota archaeon]